MWKNSLWIAIALGTLLVSGLALAQGSTPCSPGDPNCVPNPIAADDFGELIRNIATEIRRIAFPLAVLALVFAGFKFVTGAISGDAKKISEARTIFLWTLVGTAIVVGASVLAQAVVEFARTL